MVEISFDGIADVPVSELVASASQARLPDEAEERRLVESCASGEPSALAALVRAHLRIAVDEAIRNRGRGERQDRLARVGAQALVDAAPSYDPSTHGAFSAWARRIVRDAVRRAMGS